MLSRASRSFFAEAVSTTLRKPFDAWQASLVQQPAPPVSLVALTALRQSLLFAGSAKQDADDKAAVANAVASVLGSLLRTVGTQAMALAKVLTAALPSVGAGQKRKTNVADGLPAEAAALAALLHTVETLCDAAAPKKRSKKKRLVSTAYKYLDGTKFCIQGGTCQGVAGRERRRDHRCQCGRWAARRYGQGPPRVDPCQCLTSTGYVNNAMRQLLELAIDVAPHTMLLMLSLLPGVLESAELATSWVDLLHAVAQRATRHTPALAVVLVQLAAAHPAVDLLLSKASDDDAHGATLCALVYVLATVAGRVAAAPPALVDLVQRCVHIWLFLFAGALSTTTVYPGCQWAHLVQHGQLGSCVTLHPEQMWRWLL